MRAGHAGPYAQRFPLITGFDAAGTVVALGPDVHEPAVGDQVIAYLIRQQDGASGQFATAPAEQLAPAPLRIALADAAAIPVAGLTAWQAIHEHLRVRAGQRILINGAGGGVGRFAVQFAKLAGASVVAVAGPTSLERARTAGADEVIDHQEARPIGPVDGILNTATGSGLAHLIRRGGTLVSTTSPGARHSGIRTVAMIVRPDPAQLGRIAHLVDAGQVSTGVTEHLPMSEMARVHRRYAAGLLHGKIALSH